MLNGELNVLKHNASLFYVWFLTPLFSAVLPAFSTAQERQRWVTQKSQRDIRGISTDVVSASALLDEVHSFFFQMGAEVQL